MMGKKGRDTDSLAASFLLEHFISQGGLGAEIAPPNCEEVFTCHKSIVAYQTWFALPEVRLAWPDIKNYHKIDIKSY